jgi:3-methylfumaryl-CoA hydratase
MPKRHSTYSVIRFHYESQEKEFAMSDWKTWVGHTSTAQAFLDPAQANRMAATLDRPPAYVNGDLLPPAWHWLYFHDVVEGSRLGPDGHPRLGIVMPPVGMARRMWAAGTLAFEAKPRLGETAERTSTIRSIVPKQGRSGPLVFVTVEHEISVGGILGIREQQTIVYREADAESKIGPSQSSTERAFSHRWTLDSTTLFRYSALTFNAHRIHYDVEYARNNEGYPGLVIHGPLLATLLMDLATHHGGELETFAFRARSPVFAPGSVTVSGHESDAGADLWVTSDDGRLVMNGTATYKERVHV